jgi:hypothetical protein
MEEMTDPAIVKNSYSQQVTLPATARNNKIFGHIAQADRATATTTRRRAMFSTTTDRTATFNAMARVPFTLTEDGNLIESGYIKLDSIERKGATHTYKVSLYGGLGSFFYNLSYSEDGQSLTLADMEYMEGQRLDFRIYKTAVVQAWEELAKGNAYSKDSRWQIINFAPAYNGVPDTDFDADKAICDASLSIFPDTYTDDDGKKWTANGFMELSEEYTEWQTKDLRSYMQRPVMRMRAVIEACCDTAQNGGYAVHLDPTFFNNRNPYYNKAWFTLPILRTLELVSGDGVEDVTYIGGFSNNGHYAVLPIGYKANIEGATADITINVRQELQPNAYALADEQELYLGTGATPTRIAYTLRALDINGNIIFTSTGTSECRYTWSEAQDKAFSAECELSIANMTNVASIELYAELEQYNGVAVYNAGGEKVADDYYITFAPTPSATNELSYTSAQSARSGSLITQEALLHTQKTPADYLLSYCKTFGLHFLYDKANKAISIVARNTLYGSGKTINLNSKIDRAKAITITPYVFDSKWYDFEHANSEGDFAEYYHNIYGYEYGAQVVNTGFDFNAEHKAVMESVLFQGACEVRERSKYYNTIVQYEGTEALEASDGALLDSAGEQIYTATGEGKYYPSVLLDAQHKAQYVDAEGDTEEQEIAPVPASATIKYFDAVYKSYDAFSKVQFHDSENSPVEMRDVLMLFDGMARAHVAVTDDTPQMLTLNEGTPCWYLTKPEAMDIARFVRFTESHSLDFGTPQEIDNPDAEYPAEGTIYARGWEAYIADRYDVDTKVVRCFVDWRGVQVNESLLRNFYVFDNALWVLNKITNYTMTSYTTTECEFVKVKNKNSYTIGQKYE